MSTTKITEMPVRAMTVVFSHLGDIPYLPKEDVYLRTEFIKWILLKTDNVNDMIYPEKMYQDFLTYKGLIK